MTGDVPDLNQSPGVFDYLMPPIPIRKTKPQQLVIRKFESTTNVITPSQLLVDKTLTIPKQQDSSSGKYASPIKSRFTKRYKDFFNNQCSNSMNEDGNNESC